MNNNDIKLHLFTWDVCESETVNKMKILIKFEKDMKKQFKLIKEYPGSLPLHSVVEMPIRNDRVFTSDASKMYDAFPEYWEEIKEIEKLCVPIGTKIHHKDFPKSIYTITDSKESKTSVLIIGISTSKEYPIKEVNRYIIDRTWVVYIEKPILFVTEDGKEIREGDNYWYINSNLDIFTLKADKSCGKWGIYYKYFSTEQAAQEYIDMNKPIYSKKQALQMFMALDEASYGYSGRSGVYKDFLL